MVPFLRKYKKEIAAAFFVVFILAVAYLSGGNGKPEQTAGSESVGKTAFQTEARPEETLSETAEEATGKAAEETTKEALETALETEPILPSREAEEESSPPSAPSSQEETEGLSCTFSISCKTVLSHMDELGEGMAGYIPADGWILPPERVSFQEGETVFDVLKRVCTQKGIGLEASYTPLYQTAYVEGIGNLYEFDCGSLSGWLYTVDGQVFNYSSSSYVLKDGDVVEWQYTCAGGEDL